MAEFPALPLYTDAYLADTRHLTTEEHGAYLLLLMCMWRTRGCCLKDDDKLLARMVGVSIRRWLKLRLVLQDFFHVSDGRWQQKKLSRVYGAVAEKVEKNRVNGAKGGKARAERAKALEINKSHIPNGQSAPQRTTERNDNKAQPTKTKTESKETIDKQESDSFYREIEAAAGLSVGGVEKALIAAWCSHGCQLEEEILPTIRRLKAREVARTGVVPSHLAYYSAAIEEVRTKRQKQEGFAVARAGLAKQQRLFDRKNPDHWRRFLGNSSSRFRGDYMSQNWAIPTGHPVFMPADIGPDPRARPNSFIPPEIYSEYASLWGWQCQRPQ